MRRRGRVCSVIALEVELVTFDRGVTIDDYWHAALPVQSEDYNAARNKVTVPRKPQVRREWLLMHCIALQA
jgi:hypothetical protein